MAKLHQGILGAFSGKVGTVVGYTWRGVPCMRAYRREVAYPNTASQQAERDWFVSMVRFASQAKWAVRLGLRERAMEHRMTEGNYFVMRNKRCFSLTEGAVAVDYGGLVLAEGPAAPVTFGTARFEEGEVLSVGYEKNGLSLQASSEDRVYVYAYAPALGEGLLSAPSLRRSKELRMRLPQHWAGVEVQLYGFVVDREGRASHSSYIGAGRVYAPESDVSTLGIRPLDALPADAEAVMPQPAEARTMAESAAEGDRGAGTWHGAPPE